MSASCWSASTAFRNSFIKNSRSCSAETTSTFEQIRFRFIFCAPLANHRMSADEPRSESQRITLRPSDHVALHARGIGDDAIHFAKNVRLDQARQNRILRNCEDKNVRVPK